MPRQLKNADPTRPIFAWEPVPSDPAGPAPAELALFGKWSQIGRGSYQDVKELVREPSGLPQGSVVAGTAPAGILHLTWLVLQWWLCVCLAAGCVGLLGCLLYAVLFLNV